MMGAPCFAWERTRRDKTVCWQVSWSLSRQNSVKERSPISIKAEWGFFNGIFQACHGKVTCYVPSPQGPSIVTIDNSSFPVSGFPVLYSQWAMSEKPLSSLSKWVREAATCELVHSMQVWRQCCGYEWEPYWSWSEHWQVNQAEISNWGPSSVLECQLQS